jgi:hypothetical protein
MVNMGAPNPDSANEGKSSEDKILAQIESLRGQIEGIKNDVNRAHERADQNDKRLQWALTTALTIATLVLGIHSYITFSDAARDREYLDDKFGTLSEKFSYKLDETNKITTDVLVSMIDQKFDTANVELNQKLNSFSNIVEVQIALDGTNLNEQLNITREQLMEVGDKIHQKVLLGMAKMFMSMAESLMAYYQYTPVAQCYLGATHACLIGQNFEKLNVCIAGLKQAMPHMSRKGFMQIPDSTYQLDFLIYSLSLFPDKHYYGDVLLLKAERKRLTGEDYPAAYTPNVDDGYWIKKLQSPTSESSFQKAP